MAKAAKAIPTGYHAVTPYLVVSGADAAIDFYKRAFGAKETVRMPRPDGKLMHGEININGSMIMLCDELPERGALSAKTLKGSPVSIFLYVQDVDAVFKQAIGAGAREEMPLTDAFWGDRWGIVVDPFGLKWQIATHKEDLTPEEIGQRAAAAMGGAH
jgi:PhnB protein